MPISINTTERQPLLVPSHEQPHHRESPTPSPTPTQKARHNVRRFLTSKTGHYAVLLLVSLDVSSIFADFILSLYVCEHTCKSSPYPGEPGQTLDSIDTAQSVLGIVSLVFSVLFLLELLGSIWAFGPRTFFRSKFHCFDAAVIVAGFVVDVCLKGVLEEIGSIVVVLRLWRVVKIIDELSAGAEEQMEGMAERLEKAERERAEAWKEVEGLRRRQGAVKSVGDGAD